MPIYYKYNRENFVYEGEVETPTGRIPANSTELHPPQVSENQKAVFKNSNWEIVNPKQFTEFEISLGLKTIDSKTQKVNDSGEIVYKVRAELIEDGTITAEQLRLEKIQQVNTRAGELITGGYINSALGEPYEYDTELESQFNFKAILDLQTDSLYRCKRISTGVKTFVMHTYSQLQQIYNGFLQYKMSILQQADTHKNAIATLTTASEIENYTIGWAE